MSTNWPKWVRIDQNGYELTMTWVRIDQMSTNWPKVWVRIDQNEYELTWVRVDLSTNWPGALSNWDTTPRPGWGFNQRQCDQESDALPAEPSVLPMGKHNVHLKLLTKIGRSIPGKINALQDEEVKTKRTHMFCYVKLLYTNLQTVSGSQLLFLLICVGV